jgi:ParB-like chromosome segregation protein Spo0J
MKIPTRLVQTEYPNDNLKPGNKRFDKVFKSAKKVGIQEPITINLDWQVINGNHRLAVAKLLGIKEIEVEVWTGTEMVL